MNPSKIVLIDDDDDVRTLLEHVLGVPEFEVFAFRDGRDALMRLHEVEPDLIIADIMMPEMDGRTFFQVVKRSQALRHVPFLFLSAIQSPDVMVATMEEGADDYVTKPFSPACLLAKVRAILRLAERSAAVAEDRRADQLSGELGARGPFPLFKFCESVHLTGRLTVQAKGIECFADFVGGELIGAGCQPPAAHQDAMDLLLSLKEGSYRIVQRRLDPTELRRLDSSLAEGELEDEGTTAEGLVHLPGGRLTQIDLRGESVTVQTEAENRPDLAITTLIARGGRVIRKIENVWPHPLQRRQEQAVAEDQLRRQHERVVATLGDLAIANPAGAGGVAPAVDGGLLAWAVSFLGEQARDVLGTIMTAILLRRTQRSLVLTHEALRHFRVGNDGRVLIDRDRAALPRSAIAAVAAWVTAFIEEAAILSDKANRVRVRQATRMMEADLERMGFYQALGPLGT